MSAVLEKEFRGTKRTVVEGSANGLGWVENSKKFTARRDPE
jgi:hypothetical protein